MLFLMLMDGLYKVQGTLKRLRLQKHKKMQLRLQKILPEIKSLILKFMGKMGKSVLGIATEMTPILQKIKNRNC